MRLILLAGLAMALVLAGCTNNEQQSDDGGESGSELTGHVTVTDDNATTGADGNTTASDDNTTSG